MGKNTENISPNTLTRILFLDDEEAILSSIKSLIRKENYDKVFFSNPKEAILYLRENRVDIIVFDMRMMKLENDFIKSIQTVSPNSIRIILKTLENNDSIYDLLKKGIAHYYLSKPWEDEYFKRVLKSFAIVYNAVSRKKYLKILESYEELTKTPINIKVIIDMFNRELNVIDLFEYLQNFPFIEEKLLNYINSGINGVYRKITTSKDAIILLGVNRVKILFLYFTLVIIFKKLFEEKNISYPTEFICRMLNRAVIAKQINSIWEKPINNYHLLLSSLLVDIGFLIMNYIEPEKFDKLIKQKNVGDKTINEIEDELFGYTHEQIGSALLQLWNLPVEVITIVQNHHGFIVGNQAIKILQIADLEDGYFKNIKHDNSVDDLVAYYKEKLKL